MSPSKPPREVIDAEVDAGGLVHVGVFMAHAFSSEPPPVLHPRADLHKCKGGGIAVCTECSRYLAPSADSQKWLSPEIDDRDICNFFADVVMHEHLYQPGSAPKDADAA